MAADTQRARFWREVVSQVVVVLLLAALAFAIGAIAVIAVGESPVEAFYQLVRGAVGTRSNAAATVARAVPVIITGIAAAVAFKTGLFSLGMEGQMVAGGIVGAIVATSLPGLPAWVVLPLSILGGCLAGGLWALPPAWWWVSFKVPLLITTLLLNYVASLFASYLVTYPLRDLTGGAAIAQTAMIAESIQLPILIPGTRLHAGVLVLLVLPPLVYWLFKRTVLGYEMRMSGLNPSFAEYGGVAMRRQTLLTMFMSGSIAGLAGVIHVLGVDYRYIDGALVVPGYAWTGFIAALLAGSNPLTIILTGLSLSALKVGAAGLQRNTQVPLQLADVVQAVIIFLIALRLRVLQSVQKWLRTTGN